MKLQMSIRNTFLLPTLTIITIGLLIASAVLFVTSKSIIEEQMFERLNNVSYITSNRLDGWLRDRKLDLATWSTQSSFESSLKGGFVGRAAQKKATETLKHWFKEYGYYTALYLVNLDGEIIASSLDENVDQSRPFISDELLKVVAENGAIITSDVSQSLVNQLPQQQIYTPVLSNGEILGVLVGEININHIHQNLIAPITVQKQGYVFVIDNKGQVLSHRDEGLILNRNISSLEYGAKMLSQSAGTGFFVIEGMDAELSFVRLENDGWVVGAVASVDELNESVYYILTVNIVLVLLIIIFVSIALYLITGTVSNPVNNVVNELRTISKGGGDLTVYLEPEGSNEIRELATGFNGFVSNISALIAQVKTETKSLNQMMSDLSSNTERLVKSNDSISDRSTAVASAAEEMTVTVSNVASNAEAAGQSSTDARTVVKQSMETLGNVINSINSMSKVIEHAGSQVNGLATRLDGMTNVVKVIEGVAEQTNLLALNAAIEAARAGEHGRGFSVVADEVRSLAQKTVGATTEITTFIDSIHQDTSKALEAVNQGQEEAKASIGLREDANKALFQIDGEISKINDQALDIARSTSELNQVIQDIVVNIDELNKGNEQNTSNIKGIGQTIDAAVNKTSSLESQTNMFKT